MEQGFSEKFLRLQIEVDSGARNFELNVTDDITGVGGGSQGFCRGCSTF